MSERSVGLIVLTEIPGMGICAVLRERGYFNFEKMKPESWPGACQVTAHGKLEGGERFYLAIHREVEEELGEKFARIFLTSSPFEVLRLQKKNKEIVIFAIKIDHTFLIAIRLEPGSGTLRFLQKHKVDDIVDVTSFNKTEGIPDRKTVAMFPDEKEAVVKAFALFS